MAGIYKISEILQENYKLKEEVILLRKVADAARAAMPTEQYQYSQSIYKLEQALAELDKAKEGQDG
jgi:hypothetical protein